ncbi:ABC transporter substrate-binding protein [Paenibacillus contaminans]|uniref:ABC transporter substrate-binding protein n=1 Tax=Paenibacillus contaminans TaxID=450362 RepID=A0A329M407_9BACL|nr:extracellular solute-binding protein [Paenibacillus contaminans]RAV14849.1 ABC transporter substrate-binding protein [Paenibacillus contaminans]
MKRAGLTVLSGLVAVALTACSGGTAKKEGGNVAKKEGKTVITVSVRQTDAFLKLAEQKYEQTHPDIDIRIKEYAAAPDSGQMQLAMDETAFEKYLNTVNTEVMSGKGADLISLQDLPYAKYAEKKVLADLGELMAKDSSFKPDDYYANIWNASKINNGLYAMPLNFTLHLILGDAGAIKAAGLEVDDESWTWESFSELAKKLVKDANGDGKPDKYVMTNTEPESMLINLMRDNYVAYVDQAKRQAHFDSKEFLSLMEQVKEMYDDHLLSGVGASWGEQFFSTWTANSVQDLALYAKIVYNEGAVYRKPVSGQDQGGSFSSSRMLGINAKSDVKQEAWDFLKFLLSEEMQASPELKGIAMNKSLSDKQLNEIQERLKKGAVKSFSGTVPGPMTDEEMQKIKRLIGEAVMFAKTDSKINSILFKELTSYFAGQKSGEEVSKLIQNRVTTYLNE